MNSITKVKICFYIGILILLDSVWIVQAPTAGGGECSLRTIGEKSTTKANKFITAGDCLGEKYKHIGDTGKHWEKGSDYSFGNLDDFCLHTSISDDKNFYESRKRVYRGSGYQDFPILQHLVTKSAWSYQMEESLATANMDWSQPEMEYEKLNAQAYENMRRVEILKKELERRYKIRDAYTYDFKEEKANMHVNWIWNDTADLTGQVGALFNPDLPRGDPIENQPVLKYLGEKRMDLESTLRGSCCYHQCCCTIYFPGCTKCCPPNAPRREAPDQCDGSDANFDAAVNQIAVDQNGYQYAMVVKSVLFNEETEDWEANLIFNYQSDEPFLGFEDIPLHLDDPPPPPNEDKRRCLLKLPPPISLSLDDNQRKRFEDNGHKLNCLFCADYRLIRSQKQGPPMVVRRNIIRYLHYDFLYKKYEAIIKQLLEIPLFEKSVDTCTTTAAQWTSRLHPLKTLINNAKTSQYKPDYLAPNPYFVEVTGVLVKGVPLKNYLHVRVFSNRSVSDDKSRLHTNPKYHNLNERRDRTKGRMKAVLLIVKDQDGFPVGNFDKPIPCENTCRDRNHNQPVHTHSTYRNDLTCSFTPPTANVHPGVFIWPDGPKSTWSKEGVREVHATWHFAQDTCNFVTELHFQALVFEDIEGEYAGTDRFHNKQDTIKNVSCDNNEYTLVKTERKIGDDGQEKIISVAEIVTYKSVVADKDKITPKDYLEKYTKEIRNYMGRGHVWGWTAQYNIIAPTYDSVGADDWVSIPRLKYLVDHDSAAINCHASLDSHKFGFIKSVAPKKGRDIPNQARYTLKLMDDFRIALDEVDPQFFGVHYGNHDKDNYHGCRFPKLNSIFKHSINITNSLKKFLGLPTIEEYVKKEPMVRCPCPALPTTPKPEDRTIGPDQIHGRMTHGSHMTLAWMFFIPLAIFTSRYFKETFSNVFCIQEYWWLAFHVFLLLCGMVFMIGANLSVIAKETLLKPVDTKEMKAHRILGWASWAIFSFQMISGIFRNKDPNKRFWQIVIHYGAGMLNVTISIMCMGLVGNVGGSCMTCRGVIIYLGWIFFNVGIYGMMECHMSAVDEILELDPPRTRCPIPYKRLFGQDAPGRNFRMAAWLAYAVGCLTMWAVLSATIWASEGLSCRDIWQGKSSPIGQFLNQTI